jgi:hypothetical protein
MANSATNRKANSQSVQHTVAGRKSMRDEPRQVLLGKGRSNGR